MIHIYTKIYLRPKTNQPIKQFFRKSLISHMRKYYVLLLNKEVTRKLDLNYKYACNKKNKSKSKFFTKPTIIDRYQVYF